MEGKIHDRNLTSVIFRCCLWLNYRNRQFLFFHHSDGCFACGYVFRYRTSAEKTPERRAGDVAQCYANPSKAKKELGWEAEFNIEDMCKDSYNFIIKQEKNNSTYND